MKLTFHVKTPKPRNRLALVAARRGAGRHGPGGGAQRQQGKHALRREFHQLAEGPPDL